MNLRPRSILDQMSGSYRERTVVLDDTFLQALIELWNFPSYQLENVFAILGVYFVLFSFLYI